MTASIPNQVSTEHLAGMLKSMSVKDIAFDKDHPNELSLLLAYISANSKSAPPLSALPMAAGSLMASAMSGLRTAIPHRMAAAHNSEDCDDLIDVANVIRIEAKMESITNALGELCALMARTFDPDMDHGAAREVSPQFIESCGIDPEEFQSFTAQLKAHE